MKHKIPAPLYKNILNPVKLSSIDYTTLKGIDGMATHLMRESQYGGNALNHVGLNIADRFRDNFDDIFKNIQEAYQGIQNIPNLPLTYKNYICQYLYTMLDIMAPEVQNPEYKENYSAIQSTVYQQYLQQQKGMTTKNVNQMHQDNYVPPKFKSSASIRNIVLAQGYTAGVPVDPASIPAGPQTPPTQTPAQKPQITNDQQNSMNQVLGMIGDIINRIESNAGDFKKLGDHMVDFNANITALKSLISQNPAARSKYIQDKQTAATQSQANGGQLSTNGKDANFVDANGTIHKYKLDEEIVPTGMSTIQGAGDVYQRIIQNGLAAKAPWLQIAPQLVKAWQVEHKQTMPPPIYEQYRMFYAQELNGTSQQKPATPGQPQTPQPQTPGQQTPGQPVIPAANAN